MGDVSGGTRLKELQLNWALPAQEFERTRARSNEESCRQEWLHHIRETNLELATVAMSYIYLESLLRQPNSFRKGLLPTQSSFKPTH